MAVLEVAESIENERLDRPNSRRHRLVEERTVSAYAINGSSSGPKRSEQSKPNSEQILAHRNAAHRGHVCERQKVLHDLLPILGATVELVGVCNDGT